MRRGSSSGGEAAEGAAAGMIVIAFDRDEIAGYIEYLLTWRDPANLSIGSEADAYRRRRRPPRAPPIA
jgi:hypothetical protein